MKRILHTMVLTMAIGAAGCAGKETVDRTPAGTGDQARLQAENERLRAELDQLRAQLETSRLEMERTTHELQRAMQELREHTAGARDKPPMPPRDGDPERVVPVYYGTDRMPTGKAHPEPAYGSDRRPDTMPEMDYGVCIVSIPPEHQKGDHERPTWWAFEFSEDPDEHIVITSVTPMAKDSFFTALAGEVGRSSGKHAFVFVHGYNTSFDDAARTTGQLAFDLAIPGAAILYSWPSKGGMEDYVADNGEIKWTIPHLRSFLGDIRTRSGASTIHLIAHSLGNSTLREAVQALTTTATDPKPLANLVLAAPDVDSREFVRDYVPVLKAVATRITLYASEKDLALKASRKLWQQPRIGEVPTYIDGVDTIDATAVADDWFGHSYLIESPTVLEDIGTMIRANAAASARSGLKQPSAAQRWWTLQ